MNSSAANYAIGRCALCEMHGPLIRSHLLPAFLYRILRGNDNPVRINASAAYRTSYQLRRHLLCRACEDRFNEGGEKWIAANCAHTAAKSAIQLALEAAVPYYSSPKAKVYRADQISVVAPDKIAYFATSVFWRASVADWDGQPPLTLGPYEREFRYYLLGLSDFPLSASLVVTVSNRDSTRLTMTGPHGNRKSGFHEYGFFIPGMTFDLFVGGKRLTGIRERSCIVHAPERPIFLADLYEPVASRALGKLLATAKRIN
jgi:hypothetical protein